MYRIFIKQRVYKDLDKIPAHDLEKIFSAIKNLADNPRKHGTHKLRGHADRYRLRQGHYRVVYTIDDGKQRVNVVLVRHRKDVCRE